MSFVVGLTGGIGSGKSAATREFEKLGITVIDADVVARQVVEPGTAALARIAEYFGDAMLNTHGELNRTALRKAVFDNEQHKNWLNALLHPAIRRLMQQQIEQAPGPYCILAVPLLIENNLTGMCQRVLVIDCPESLQLARAVKRDGSDEQVIKNIMKSQASREQRREAADDIIDNSGEIDALAPQVTRLHQQYLSLSAPS
ncbi:dephospho-CoA kinase [Salinimonas marina]|uniref:Dephospho-CoA kinase n=1 Tax=Salinimonas marina TaxID=2785918 RepID=A0A7S9E0B2_9ALTE|nr:dephospho-CoA kinase [Salinimonas marina]QPG07127.1 dephospho-CoA kinase [Salinimonas marina]